MRGPTRAANEARDWDDDAPHPQYMPHTKKPQSLMLLGVIASTGAVSYTHLTLPTIYSV